MVRRLGLGEEKTSDLANLALNPRYVVGTNDYPLHMFLWRNKKNIYLIPAYM